MKKIHQNGFGSIEVLLLLLILAVAGFGGYYVWHSQKQSADAAAAVSNNTSQKTATTTKTKTIPDQYAGWATYCGDGNVCYRYPSDWQQVMHEGMTEAGSFKSSNGSVIAGSNVYEDDQGDLTEASVLHTTSLSPVVGKSNLKIWGGYYDAGTFYVPRYQIIDTALTGSSGLAVGKDTSTKSTQYPYFSLSSSALKYNFTIFASKEDPYKTKAETESWFDSTDGKTALKIAQSVYFK